MLRNESGFTLLETVVAMGVGTVVLMGNLQMNANLQKTVQGVSQKADFIDMMSTVSMQLMRPETCKAVVVGQPYMIPGHQEIEATLPGIGVLKTGTRRDGWKFTSVRLEHLSSVNTTDQNTKLVFEAEKIQITPGPQTTRKEFNFRVKIDSSSKVEDCA